jgi:hypothetical protein
MATFQESLEQLLSVQKDAETWKTGPMMVTVAISLSDDEAREIDLSATIGHGNNPPREGKRNDTNCYWLQRKFNQNNEEFRGKEIHPIFVRACHAAGFIAHCEYNHFRKAIVIICHKGRVHDEEKSRQYTAARPRNVKDPSKPPVPRKRKTGKAVKEEGEDDDEKKPKTCKVRFTIYWDEKSGRWFLPHQQRGNIVHCKHMHVVPQHLPIQSKFVPREELQIAKDALTSKISATAAGSLLRERTGISLNWQQLQYLKTKDTNQLVMSKKGSTSPTGHTTAADRLLADLNNDPTVSFLCLFADVKSGLITIKQRHKRTNNSSSIEEEEAFTADLEDDICSPKEFAQDMTGRENLVCADNGQMLLAIAWTNDEARRKFDMYPEFMGGDDTEDTNSEKRPLYTLMGKDNSNKSFGHTWCFMPSKSLWVFRWIFGHAVPILHPGTACERVELINTDADTQETRACDKACQGQWQSWG